jgi:hypothetical protein
LKGSLPLAVGENLCSSLSEFKFASKSLFEGIAKMQQLLIISTLLVPFAGCLLLLFINEAK